MRFLVRRSLLVLLGRGTLVAVMVGCGRHADAGEETEPERGHEETVSCRLDPGYCPGDDDDGQYPDPQDSATASGGSSSSGGSSNEGGQGMAGAPQVSPRQPNFLHMVGEGLLASATESGPLTSYSAIPRPQDTQVHARLDDVEMRTGVIGSATFLLEECEETEGDTQVCQLTVHNINGTPSGSPEVDAPFDSRLASFGLEEPFVTSVVVEGDSWSAHIQPEGMQLNVYRWDGAVIEERYEDEELVFMRVEEESLYGYALPVTDIEVNCSVQECSLSLSAGVQ